MFPSLATRERYVAETHFAARKQENVFASGQNHFCSPDKHFASETYVSQFSLKEMLIRFPVLLFKNVYQQRRAYNNG